MVRLVAAVAVLAVAVVVATAAPSAGDDDEVTWEQVRSALEAARTRPPDSSPLPPAPEPTPGGDTMVISVTIPDLSWALDDPTAPDGVRRAACHQATRTDDETAGPLAACLRHVRGQHADQPEHGHGRHVRGQHPDADRPGHGHGPRGG